MDKFGGPAEISIRQRGDLSYRGDHLNAKKLSVKNRKQTERFRYNAYS